MLPHNLYPTSRKFFYPSQKWRISDYDLSIRPMRFRSVRIKYGISALDRFELAQDRLWIRMDTVADAPLDIADPNRRAR